MLHEIYLSSDHTGVSLKSEIKLYLEGMGYIVHDYGCTVEDIAVDYPDYAIKVARSVIANENSYGILICGTGIGMSIAINRYKKIRGALCYSKEIAYYAKKHNNANVLCLGSRYTDVHTTKLIVKEFLNTKFATGRHVQRLEKIENLVSTVNNNEVMKFSTLASEWWNENGKFKPLHMINPIRSRYIIDKVKENFVKDLKSLTLLDIGCGGGLLSESMARSGMNVTGIDVSQENIEIARTHAFEGKLQINYQCQSIEDLISANNKYDIITIMEVIEHVENVPYFIDCACKLLQNNGLIFISTLNRTIKSWACAIVMAEYILRWLPKKTHSWDKFIKPSELSELLSKNNVIIQELVGINYNIMNGEWEITSNNSVNYIVCALR